MAIENEPEAPASAETSPVVPESAEIAAAELTETASATAEALTPPPMPQTPAADAVMGDAGEKIDAAVEAVPDTPEAPEMPEAIAAPVVEVADATPVADVVDATPAADPVVADEAAPVAVEDVAATPDTTPDMTPDMTTEVAAAAEPAPKSKPARTPTALEAAEAAATAAAIAEGRDPNERKARPPAPSGDRPAITAPTNIGEIGDDLSAEEFAAVIERTVFEFKEGDIVAGTVVRVDPDEALIDIGYKSEGVIPAKELSIRNSANPSDVVSVGDEIEALVLQKEDENGRLLLSKKRAQYERAWGRIERVMNEGGTVTGPVIEVVKGGLIVDIGLRGFLPASLVDLRRVRDLQPFVGESIEAKVIELDKNRNNVVLSRRAWLEEAQADQRQEFLDDLKPGDVRPGVVSSVVNFGAFVDLGGMDGLVHVSELSWQHVSHPSEVVNVGDKVDIKVLEVDRERERISLSIRQTREDPWDTFAREVQPGSVIDGSVTKTVPFGAFVSVGDGVEGLVHVSEIAIHHVESPELELSIGQAVKVRVTEIDAERRRVSLSVKQALPEWEERSQFPTEQRRSDEPSKPRRREFQREEEAADKPPSFNADASLEAILQELKERGIGRS